MGQTILIRHAVLVPAPVEEVYRFTQDFSQRATWDGSITSATVLEAEPARRVRVRMKGGHEAIFVYRAERVEHGAAGARATSVAMSEVRSWLLESGGGVWTYEDRGGQTQWTQAMRLSLRRGVVMAMLRPLVAWALASEVRRSMAKVVARFAGSGG